MFYRPAHSYSLNCVLQEYNTHTHTHMRYLHTTGESSLVEQSIIMPTRVHNEKKINTLLFLGSLLYKIEYYYIACGVRDGISVYIVAENHVVVTYCR